MSVASNERSSSERVQDIVYHGIQSIGDFVLRPAFQKLLAELYALPHAARAEFVDHVILNPTHRRSRGIEVPEDLLIQRSSFADGRPTLFCVSKILPLAYPWHRVTITFDTATEDLA